jgi:hypothetical protein
MSLRCLRDDCHKQVVTHIRESQRFEMMYTLQGKTLPTQHVHFPHQSTYAWRTLPAGGPRMWQPFTSHQQSWTESLLPRKRAPDTIPSMPADWCTGPHPVSLLNQSMKQWRKPHIYQQQATRLTGPISPACDRYVQYLLAGANRTFLTRHRRGLQPWRCQLSVYHFLTFPTSCLPFPLVAPPILHFNQALTTKPKFWVLKNLWPSRCLLTTRSSIVTYIYA